jgi:uncharacterized protein (TIGR02680 family)
MGGRRFQPSRAGIVNLWDYRDEEFLFVNGWLVLRGPNGSGKTKALEVLFPFVLDGRIEPRRLNPFASEERTMKSNLLYRGQEVSHAYVWMEFCRPAEEGRGDEGRGDERRGEEGRGEAGGGEAGGAAEYVTIGIGLRAHRHVDRVTRWHFVVDGRVGVDFSLIDADDRPLNRRDLIIELGPDTVHDGPEEYRRAVDARLFGLGPARYEQLLDLVLTLRKPQLAKDLNPVELSRTLQKGLRPLDEALIVEAAGSFDDMEAVARTLEGLVAADEATTTFLSVYSTYLRTHARAAADALSARRSATGACRADVDAAIVARAAAEQSHQQAVDRVEVAEAEPGRLRSHVDSLKSSAAYRSHEQLEDLRRHVHDLALELARARATEVREASTVEARAAELVTADQESDEATRSVHRLVGQLTNEAETAGIPWAATDADPDGFVARIGGRTVARREDVRVIREYLARLAQAERDHERAAREATTAESATGTAEQAERAAAANVATERERVRGALVAWRTDHTATLAELSAGDPAAASAEVFAGDPAAVLVAAVENVGEPGSPTPREVLAEWAGPGLARVRDEAARLTAESTALTGRRDVLAGERDRIAAEQDDAPAAAPARPADRTDRPGAPLWRLVDFARGVKAKEKAGVEAALEAAGLLDAWLHPDPAQTSDALRGLEQDGYLVALTKARRPAGRTLADLLVPERNGDVPAEVVEAVLASVAVRDDIAPGDVRQTTISGTGQFGHGVLLGSHTKPAPEYIGATARARRRAARITECERLIGDLATQLAEVSARQDGLRELLAGFDVAAQALPPLVAVQAALRELDRAATALRLRRDAESAARAELNQAVAEQSAAALVLRRASAERSLPAERVDAVADAVGRFEAVGVRLEPARRAAAPARTAVTSAQARHAEAAYRLADAHGTAREAGQRHQEKSEAYETLSAAVGDADVHRVVREVAETEAAIERAETQLRGLRERYSAAVAAVATAHTRVEATLSTLDTAVREANQDSLRLRPFAHADLLSLLRCPTDLRWPAQPWTGADASGTQPAELPAEIAALHEAILAATRELAPTENSLKQSGTRLTGALAELQAQLPAAGLDHRPEFDTDDGVIVVRIADEQGLTPVAVFADRIVRERHEQEQLLSEAERRVFEDALLTQLARQIHHRTIEARDLVEGMDVQMRSRRMSSGLTVGVGWQLSDDLDVEQRETCKLLERDPARLGPTQLATLRGHFARRIKAARAMAPEQSYRELLAQVLDYRQWRVFAFTLHRPGAGAENLTRARHSQLSGGEQSVSLHLPLFAAANALFSSASPSAPRMVGMDEAFAGVDENGRGELMSLANQFDLDLFMTGFDLWATHPAVPGSAHYDLSHSAVEHAVATVLIVWNGTVPTADFDGTLARALGSPETRRRPSAPDTSTVDSDELELEFG